MLRTIGVLSAAALLSLPLATMPAAAARSGPMGQTKPGLTITDRPIVFASINNTGGTSNQSDIYTINADNTKLLDLTPANTTLLRDPAWSPNGSTIAYSAPSPLGGRYIYAMKADGSQPTQVTSGLYYTDSQPAWSPDGMNLAFISDRGGNPQLWTMSLSDGTMTQRTTTAVAPANPSWSPDGSNIVYSSAGNIYMLYSTSINPLPFVRSGKAHTPDWSPDGNSIVYVDGETVWVRSVDGLTSTMVGTYLGASSPHWALNGSQLTLSARDSSGHTHLYVIGMVGNWLKQVTFGLNDDVTPDW
jgi:Tol biopolymer transport system component